MRAMSARDKKAKGWVTFSLNTQTRLLSNKFSLACWFRRWKWSTSRDSLSLVSRTLAPLSLVSRYVARVRARPRDFVARRLLI